MVFVISVVSRNRFVIPTVSFMFIYNLYCLSVHGDRSENKITKILRETKEITRTLRETDKITNFSRETKQITTILCETEKITKNVA